MSYLPTKDEILSKAQELYVTEAVKAGLPAITPKEEELKEGNYFQRARDQLLSERSEAIRAELGYLEQMASEVGMRVVPKKLAERAEELDLTLKRLRESESRRREAEKALEEGEARREDTRELKRRLLEAELTVKELEKKLEAVPAPTPQIITPPPKVAPPPPLPPERPPPVERVVSRECWPLYKRLWNAINNERAIESSIKIVSGRTGIGTALIAEAVTYAKKRNTTRIDDLANRLLECLCLEEK